MAQYYDPKEVKANGEKLPTYVKSTSFSECHNFSAGQGKNLVAMVNNGAWDVALAVTNERDFNELLTSYKQGHYLTWSVYLMTTPPTR